MINAKFVELCYRAILGRPPESKSVVKDKIRGCSSPEALIKDLLNSPEFEARRLGLPGLEAQRLHVVTSPFFNGQPRLIDVRVTDDQRAALFQRLQSQWTALGASEPFWSVLTHDGYRTSNLDDQARRTFYETGAPDAALVERACSRTGVEVRRGVCLELGCGVGRITKHLAARFENVVALDISAGNLQQAREMAHQNDINNIEFRLIGSLLDIKALDRCDFFYSVITLQHNPPPVQYYILDSILQKINSGGGFLFQTQTYNCEYQFIIADYLKSPTDDMDMHSLPMFEILDLLKRHGCWVKEVMEDAWTGRFGSHTFFGLAGGPESTITDVAAAR